MAPLRDDELGEDTCDVADLTDLFVGERAVVQELPGAFEAQHCDERTLPRTNRCQGGRLLPAERIGVEVSEKRGISLKDMHSCSTVPVRFVNVHNQLSLIPTSPAALVDQPHPQRLGRELELDR